MSIDWAEAELAAVRKERVAAEDRARDLRAREERLAVYIEVERERLAAGAVGTTGVPGEAGEPDAPPRPEAAIAPAVELGAQAQPAVVTVTPIPSKAARAREAATTMIREAGRPMSTRELVEPLKRLGIEPWSPKYPERITSDLGKVLRDAPGLTHFQGVGWGLKEWRPPEGGDRTAVPDADSTGDGGFRGDARRDGGGLRH